MSDEVTREAMTGWLDYFSSIVSRGRDYPDRQGWEESSAYKAYEAIRALIETTGPDRQDAQGEGEAGK